jgi:hypothetical protein
MARAESRAITAFVAGDRNNFFVESDHHPTDPSSEVNGGNPSVD